jgi:glycine/D-amino acid oxidase-like deaminating enzyme/nitrite reductase/ring-hydroxylating ferredoxin subunit
MRRNFCYGERGLTPFALTPLNRGGAMATRTESLWRGTHPVGGFAPLPGNLSTDVAIVGGGISGLTAALILTRAGKRVALLERDRIGSGETGNTTSHLTEAVDRRYQRLHRDFGEEGARLVAQSSRDAIDWIEALVREAGIDCGFARVPGYLYTEREKDIASLADELDAARRAGCAVEWTDQVPLPFRTCGAVRWDGQGQLHATAYLDGLLKEAITQGLQLYENTRVLGVHEDDPCRIDTDRGTVRAAHVFVAAHVPVNNRVLLHTKIAAYRSYAIAAQVASDAGGLFWDTDDPYHYTRTQLVNGQTYLIVGGEDHRTGEKIDTDACYERLVAYARERFGVTSAQFRWSGQIVEPVDGLPFIGRNAVSQRVYVATGYAGNGMTFGTLAGTMIGDLILDRANPYSELYDATRIKPLSAAYEYVKENLAFPTRLITDRLTSLNAQDRAVQSLRPGEGGVFDSDEGKVAVCRDRQNVMHACSAVCTHLGCDVAWNGAEQTWDCPCHGSRFSPDGVVLNGPAVSDLRHVPVMTTR